jgi:hypothetical protein
MRGPFVGLCEGLSMKHISCYQRKGPKEEKQDWARIKKQRIKMVKEIIYALQKRKGSKERRQNREV